MNVVMCDYYGCADGDEMAVYDVIYDGYDLVVDNEMMLKYC